MIYPIPAAHVFRKINEQLTGSCRGVAHFFVHFTFLNGDFRKKPCLLQEQFFGVRIISCMDPDQV